VFKAAFVERGSLFGDLGVNVVNPEVFLKNFLMFSAVKLKLSRSSKRNLASQFWLEIICKAQEFRCAVAHERQKPGLSFNLAEPATDPGIGLEADA
jgi:hypothetical protein